MIHINLYTDKQQNRIYVIRLIRFGEVVNNDNISELDNESLRVSIVCSFIITDAILGLGTVRKLANHL